MGARFKSVDQLILHYYCELEGIADVHFLRKTAGKGLSTIIALIEPTGNQDST